MTDTGITPKLFNQISQMGHAAGGAAIVLTFALLWRASYAPFVGLGAVALAAGVKEFWYDYKYESTEVRGSSMEDFEFYMIGASAATLVAMARWYW